MPHSHLRYAFAGVSENSGSAKKCFRAVFTSLVLALFVAHGGTASAEPTPSLSEVRDKVSALGEQMAATNEEHNTLSVQLEESRQRQKQLEDELSSAGQNLDVEETKVGEIGSAAYQMGASYNTFNALVTSSSPQVLLDQLTYLTLFNSERQESLTSLTQARDEAQDAKKKVDSEVKIQATKEEELRKKKEELEKDLAHWEDLREQLDPTPPSRGNYTYNGNASGLAEIAVKYAYDQIGKPYSFGAAGPNAFDCSGLTMAAWAQAGVSLPHSSNLQFSYTSTKVDRSALAPGDLITFYGDMHHVAIYVGNGQVIHAPQPGETVTVAAVSAMPYAGAVRPG